MDAVGIIHLIASLADDTKISQAVSVSKNGQLPFFAAPYGGKGLILGWITFSNAPAEDLIGDVNWFKPNMGTAKYYPGGFSFPTVAFGSRYTPPAAGQKLLDLTNGQLVLDGGNWGPSITNLISLGANNKVTSSTDNKLKLTFTTSTGLFKRSVINPDTLKPIPFNGVVSQKQNFGFGYFLWTGKSGPVRLLPVP